MRNASEEKKKRYPLTLIVLSECIRVRGLQRLFLLDLKGRYPAAFSIRA